MSESNSKSVQIMSDKLDEEIKFERLNPKKVQGTFFVNFTPMFDNGDDKLDEKINEILKKYDHETTVTKTYDSWTGKVIGFVWIDILKTIEGEEATAKNNFKKIAYDVAHEVGDLIVEGPYC